MSMKFMLPMSSPRGRYYTVTLSEQQDLSRKFGMPLDTVLAHLSTLRNRMFVDPSLQQKTANKTKRLIESHFEKQ
jgi:hypothetical protein